MDKEKQFKYLCSKIDEQIQNNKIVSDNIFEEFKKEYLKLKKIYANNRANMNFVKYNYFSRRVYQNTMNNNYKINISLASILAYLQMNISNTSVYIYKIKMMNQKYILKKILDSLPKLDFKETYAENLHRRLEAEKDQELQKLIKDRIYSLQITDEIKSVLVSEKVKEAAEKLGYRLIITRNKMVRKLHTQLLTINWGASGMILISDQFFYSEQTF